jgi:hypothetical protein
MAPRHNQLSGGAVAIMGRSFDSLSRANLRMHLAMATAFAHRHNVQLRYVALPSDMDADPLDFAAARMAGLFDLGVGSYAELMRTGDEAPLAGGGGH